SAIRITHLPTGIVVECQEERSQHKNRAKAMAWLAAKLQDQQDAAAHKEISDTRRLLVGSGDRSERIRTYNFPQGRVTDHRINLTLYSLAEVMAGAVDQVIEPLRQEFQADQLAALGDWVVSGGRRGASTTGRGCPSSLGGHAPHGRRGVRSPPCPISSPCSPPPSFPIRPARVWMPSCCSPMCWASHAASCVPGPSMCRAPNSARPSPHCWRGAAPASR